MGLACSPRRSYEPAMLSRPRALPAGFIAPRFPTSAPQPPSGALWLHESITIASGSEARKERKRVRLYSRWRFLLIAGDARAGVEWMGRHFSAQS
jgi:hypothetical protein